MKLVKVKILTSFAQGYHSYVPRQVVTVTEDLAASWIRWGWAEPVPTEPESATVSADETATVDSAKAKQPKPKQRGDKK